MKRTGWLSWARDLVLVLVLCLPLLSGCGPLAQTKPTAFDTLAHQVPGDAEQAFFLNLKPGGEAGRHWAQIRQQLEANPSGEQMLQGLLSEFKVEEYGLEEFALGPAVSGYWHGANYALVQVSDEGAVEDAFLQHFEKMAWEQEAFEGQTLHHGLSLASGYHGERLAWTVHDGLLIMVSWYVYAVQAPEALTTLKALSSLAEEDSLASLSSWQELRDRLPEDPMGVAFINVAEQARGQPSPPPGAPLSEALGHNVEAIAFAAVPEQDGMRVEIVGTVALQADAPPELRALLELPTVDPSAWTNLPANTAITLMAHDAPVVWPALADLFNVESLEVIRDTVGLDLEADLAGADGPLSHGFALGITPPLPEQPISQAVPAGQMLFLGQDASEAQMADVQAAMEGRGAVFGPREVEGLALRTQVGTELSGYAISYGFDNGTFLLGTSPGVVGRAAAARREKDGLVANPVFRAVAETWPDDPSFVTYLNDGPLISLARANMTEEQYQNSPEWRGLEVFEAIGLGLRFERDRLDGAIYFFLAD
jgi:hypothetical protein